jgi:uncharacterized protein (DUF169 family)
MPIFGPRWGFSGLAHGPQHSVARIALPRADANLFIAAFAGLRDCEEEILAMLVWVMEWAALERLHEASLAETGIEGRVTIDITSARSGCSSQVAPVVRNEEPELRALC